MGDSITLYRMTDFIDGEIKMHVAEAVVEQVTIYKVQDPKQPFFVEYREKDINRVVFTTPEGAAEQYIQACKDESRRCKTLSSAWAGKISEAIDVAIEYLGKIKSDWIIE